MVVKSYLSEAGEEVEGGPKGHWNAEKSIRGLAWPVVLVQVLDDIGALINKFRIWCKISSCSHRKPEALQSV
jgi:hypothetical protein